MRERNIIRGRFRVKCVAPNGKVRWEMDLPNGIVNEGIEYLLDAGFNDGAKITTWYIGLINNAGFSALANADTMASHAGWDESAAYAEANRPTWGSGAATSRTITNATSVDFSINATVTIRGIFVTSNNTKSGTTGTLWSTAAFGTNASANNGDTLKVTYTVSG